MFRARTVATILAGGLAVAACGTDSSPTAPESASTPSYRTENSPPGPGAQITPIEGGFFSTFTAPDAPYFVAIGLTQSAAEEFCSGGDPELGTATGHFKEKPNGDIQFMFKSSHKVPLLLFPAGTESICDGSPVAEGTGVYTENSSNFFAGGRGTSGFRIRGEVTDLAGEVLHVLVVVHSQLTSEGFVDIVEKIEVH
jgi:hypothetical protein